jgi:hypothetical protein
MRQIGAKRPAKRKAAESKSGVHAPLDQQGQPSTATFPDSANCEMLRGA